MDYFDEPVQFSMKTLSTVLLGLGAVIFSFAFAPEVFAAPSVNALGPGDTGLKLLGAGVAFGLAAAGAGVGLGQSGAAAIAAVVEKPEVRTTALIFVALAEAIAIYGFVMAIIILGSTG
jgi:V/A-type H+-transporting ATPase subunit K